MKMEISNHVAISVKDYDKAVKYYKDVVGMEVTEVKENETGMKCGQYQFWICREEPAELVFFDFQTDDINATFEKLKSEGCVETSRFSDKSIMIKDPYGMRFHLFEE